jgi:hypothetical protein
MRCSCLRLVLLLCLAALFVIGCETAPPPRTSFRSSSYSADSAAAVPERPGLGTRWGETRESRVVASDFRRATPRQPIATAAVHYNDEEGIRAMAGAVQPRRERPLLAGPIDEVVSVELRDQSGALLPGLKVGDFWFVVGEAGRRYSIVVRNASDRRVEVVLSVDGLDVIDGRPASYRKRGYVIPPRGRISVDGFRQSTREVAAFRFGSVSESYANRKHGDTRNVGVIGIAVFHEYGTDPFALSEAERRLKASPFPGGFASPPEPIPYRPRIPR